MNQAELYAQTLHKAAQKKDSDSFDSFFTKFVAVLKTKGHSKLMPAVLRSLQSIDKTNKSAQSSVLIVRDASQKEALKEQLAQEGELFGENTRVVEDKNVVGGYILKNKTSMIDKSYRSKLIGLYKKLSQ